MRSSKHLASAMAAVAAMAVAVAMRTGSPVSASGSDPVGRIGSRRRTRRAERHGGRGRAGSGGLCEAAGRVRREPRSDRPARALLRAGSALRLLPHADDEVASSRSSNERTTRRARAGAAVRRQQPAARASRAKSAPPARSTIFAATTRRAGRPISGATAQIAYRELWPGVDLRLHEQAGTLKYEFRVRARRPARGHPPRLRGSVRPDARRRRRAADRAPARRAARLRRRCRTR